MPMLSPAKPGDAGVDLRSTEAATIEPGEEPSTAFKRARLAMQNMREARAGLLAPEVPGQRIQLPH